MYFSFRRILLMVLVHHFVLPAPVRMPSASRPFAIRSIEYNGIEAESLDKKAVVDLLKNVPSDIADVLLLRQQLAKSSVKKVSGNAKCCVFRWTCKRNVPILRSQSFRQMGRTYYLSFKGGAFYSSVPAPLTPPEK